jgi:hypothetical protein
VPSSDGKRTYVVRWSGLFHRNPDVQFDYDCECAGYKHRGTCKHITEARKLRCGWSQFIDGGEPAFSLGYLDEPAQRSCPECCGEVYPTEWSV